MRQSESNVVQAADSIINAGWVIPISPEGVVLEKHSVIITDGKIQQVVPNKKANQIIAKQVYDLPNHALLPGLVNCHGHAAMTLLRGIADDESLTPWLEKFIWPAEKKYVCEDFVRDGGELAIAEMILSGTTTFSDMYFFPEIMAELALSKEIRCQLSFPIIDFQSPWSSSPEDCISKGLELLDLVKHRELINIIFGPHSTYSLSEESLKNISMLTSELDVGIQIHLHETTEEVLQSVVSKGERPLQQLHRLGLLGPKTQCVHMTELNNEDIDTLVLSGAHVIHCPESNMKLASGICPITKLLDAGVNVGLGTDGAASNNDLNLFGEMQTCALLAKVNDMNATSLSTAKALSLGTIGGARTLGLEEKIGTIENGKLGDLIAVNMDGIEMLPTHNVISQLVYVSNGSQVTHSWISGKQVMDNRHLIDFDVSDLKKKIKKWQNAISKE